MSSQGTQGEKNATLGSEVAEKLNVSRQSVSKWEGALSIPNLNKIIKLGEIFGVSTDYLLKDEKGVYEQSFFIHIISSVF